MSSASHSGDFGDVIYSLPVFRYMGLETLYLSAADFTRLKMTPERAAMFERLLLSQDYVGDVQFHWGREVAVNLDKFRYRFRNHMWDETLAEMHCRTFGVPESELDRPWIKVKPKKVAPVIINLTERYRNPEFPWDEVYEKYKDVAAFVGTKTEWMQYKAHYGPIEHCQTEDLLDVAQVVRGSKLFIGNQSCPLAIAHAMQHPTVCEYSRNACNGMIRKIKCVGTAGKTIRLPNVI